MSNRTPIYTALVKYAKEHNLRLHMPGHIGGQGFTVKELAQLGAMDVTEVAGLDDLHMSLEVIEEARQQLSRAFGAGESFFLVNGATSGIHALFMSLDQPEGEVLVPRNAHRAFFAGMVLSGARPIYIPCQVEASTGISLSVRPEEVFSLLQQHPDVEAVFITSPSYYGTTCDIKHLAELTVMGGKPLLVDEAHGAHFPFHSAYPRPALAQGADAVVNGLHKTLPVLNQGACLHMAKSCLSPHRVFNAVSLLTTTSPSYPILASIDLARQFMEEKGPALLERAWILAREYRGKINRIKGLRCLQDELIDTPGVSEMDPLKVVVSVQGLSINGFQVSRLLRSSYKIQVELDSTNIIMAMMSMFHDRDDWESFYHALDNIAAQYAGAGKRAERVESPPLPRVILTPREAYLAAKKRVSLQESCGLVAGEMVVAYPPGIPCLLPGEAISAECLEYIRSLQKSGTRIQGPGDPTLSYIEVIDC